LIASCKDSDDTVAVSGVTVEPTSLSLVADETSTLVATVSPDDADDKTVTWSSDNTEVATVTSGVVTAVSTGTATITVTTTDGAKTAVCEVTVSDAENDDEGEGEGDEEGEGEGDEDEEGEGEGEGEV
jgi:uncharacterized protein YjdB